MKDDAIAPVIAVMLILAAVVTVYAIWNAVYVPAEKESSEIEHLKNVESAFQHFSSDLEFAVTSHQNHLLFSEPVQLGGGDVSVNLLKSSGTLQVQTEDKPVYNITFANSKWPPSSQTQEFNATMANFSYEPTNNFWQDQGYRWQYGYINVTKYGSIQSPLNFYNMTSVNNSLYFGALKTLPQSFTWVDSTRNWSGEMNANGENCSSLDIYAVSVAAAPEKTFVSGNGYGTLRLESTFFKSTIGSPVTNADTITFGAGDNPFGTTVLSGLNSSFVQLNQTCKYNIAYAKEPSDSLDRWSIRQEASPVNITLHIVNITIGAY